MTHDLQDMDKAGGLEGWPVAEQQLWWLTDMQDLLKVLIQRSKLCQLIECHLHIKNTQNFFGISKNQSNSYEYGPKTAQTNKRNPHSFLKSFINVSLKLDYSARAVLPDRRRDLSDPL